MKRGKLVRLMSVMLGAIMLLAGCGSDKKKEEPTVEFKSKDGSYAISAPEGWKKSEEQIDGSLSIESAQGNLTILIQQFTKTAVSAMYPTREEFIQFYKQAVTSNFGDAKTMTENPAMTGSTLIEAEEYTITQGKRTEQAYIVYLETDYAYYVAVAGGLNSKYKEQFEMLQSCIGTFREDAQVIASLTPELSDTLLWFNGTYGLLTASNRGNLQLVGGFEANDTTKQQMIEGLKNSWDVTDRASADENLKWLLEEGHNSDLLELYQSCEMDIYTKEELVQELENAKITGIDAVIMLLTYDAVQQYGENAIKAWDLCRAMQMSTWYYLAGYYTYEEAMDQSLEIAKLLQSTYTSWDDMMQSYLYGFQYWNEDDSSDETSDSYARKQLYERLKTQENSPYQLDWNMTLTKDW